MEKRGIREPCRSSDLQNRHIRSFEKACSVIKAAAIDDFRRGELQMFLTGTRHVSPRPPGGKKKLVCSKPEPRWIPQKRNRTEEPFWCLRTHCQS